ncbi:MAG: multifunctional oxoglutarate decarboxylase/oxoglutarate dehydrogenase thiamine pyrophosphate-binding subunit/dihydrolipoyllysine-residue succinyltransferase subunit [Nitriliruptorales bacterium]
MAINELESTPGRGADGFGVNTWLVDELYEQYQRAPESLSPCWRDFFADYRSADTPLRGPVAATPGEAPVKRTGPPIGEDGVGSEHGEVRQEEARPETEGLAVQQGPKPRTPPAEGPDEGAPQPARLRGVAAVIAENMSASREVPTATSVRDVPAKLLEVNRTIINNYFQRTNGGPKVSFTHLIAYAALRALDAVPNMRCVYTEVDGAPALVRHETVNLGIAMDVERDGQRALLVPNIKQADAFTFNEVLQAYEDLVRRTRLNQLRPADFQGTTMTITNPGMIGTVASVPRLMAGQSVILGVGAIDYSADFAAADRKTVARLGLSKWTTLTSTYDHRVIMGAESGDWLASIHQLLLGEDRFYDEIFASLGIPYEPARWREDHSPLDSEWVMVDKQSKVDALAHQYRVRGHLIADLDPLGQEPPQLHPELDPTSYGLSIWDLDREFITGLAGDGTMTLGRLLGLLRDAYCRTVGVEYMHISDPEQKRWIQQQVEGVEWDLSLEDKRDILRSLNAAEAFERFLHTKYIGHKRFSLEGSESFLPLVDAILQQACQTHMDEVVMGMAHRGRLNVLANLVGKSYEQIFHGFEGDIDPQSVQGTGDVKYHLGASGVFRGRSGDEVRLTIPSNPSHLEAVDGVVEGIVRAKQDLHGCDPDSVLPILVHGDAAFAGQGPAAETLNLSQLPGYHTGGTIHVIINNQLGYTCEPRSGRSSPYPTDIAKGIQAPILHVNGDDPEAAVRVARLAFAYRRRFHRDVVIDLVCYRKYGHNEADDPSYTQPLMYAKIERRRSVRKLYTERLVTRGDISLDEAEEALEDFQSRLDEAFERTKEAGPAQPHRSEPGSEPRVAAASDTGVAREKLDRVVDRVLSGPEGFNLHPKLKRIFDQVRIRYSRGRVEWPLGEQLAFGSLLLEGASVRLVGQDSRRGTFSQRHAVLVDYDTGEEFLPLQHLAEDQGEWYAYDSPLSEYAALGFEYGYSVASPDALTLWEAQFGDFINNAQAIVDEFIVAGEEKWGQESGLVLLLPHGYEGQGPDHSSARMERFLQLAAGECIVVANPTTASQYFHLLRRQHHQGEHRTPLVVFTPKSLLRSKNATSDLDELTSGHFHATLDDPGVADRDEVGRVVLCTGKVAYEAMRRRDEKATPAAIVRVEQVYPWPEEQIIDLISGYPKAEEVLWLQEEPENMGAWPFVHGRLHRLLRDTYRLKHASRDPSPSPATGSASVHSEEQERLLDSAFQGL